MSESFRDPNSPAPEFPTLRPDVLRRALMAPRGPIPRLEVVDEIPSTQSALVQAVREDPDEWPDMSVIAASHQTQGRGRSGRDWVTPRGAVTASIVLRPENIDVMRWSWIPLLAGLAAVRAVRKVAKLPETGLKWPNDVVIDVPDASEVPGWGTLRKLGGVLTEIVPDPAGGRKPLGAVVGFGINVAQTQNELPVEWAGSLASVGSPGVDPSVLLTSVLRSTTRRHVLWGEHEGAMHSTGLAALVRDACVTIGQEITVDLPGGEQLRGVADGLDMAGHLVVRTETGDIRTIFAGDVRNVRGVESTQE